MFDLAKFDDLIQDFREKLPQLSFNPDLANDNIALLEAHELSKKITALEATLQSNISDEQKERAVKDFLKERDARVTRSNIGYTSKPNSIANLFCKSLAESILPQAHSNRDLYQVLMPSLNITEAYSPLEVNNDLPDYGSFILSDALLNGKPGKLIGIDILNNHELTLVAMLMPGFSFFAKEAAKTAEANKQNLTNILQPLSDHEIARLRNFSPSTKAFFDNLEKWIKSVTAATPPTPVLKQWAVQLRSGGSSRNGGDFYASAPSFDGLAFFFNYFDCLSPVAQAQLNQYIGHIPRYLSNSENLDGCVETNSSRIYEVVNNTSDLDNSLTPFLVTESVVKTNLQELKNKRRHIDTTGKDCINKYPPISDLSVSELIKILKTHWFALLKTFELEKINKVIFSKKKPNTRSRALGCMLCRNPRQI